MTHWLPLPLCAFLTLFGRRRSHSQSPAAIAPCAARATSSITGDETVRRRTERGRHKNATKLTKLPVVPQAMVVVVVLLQVACPFNFSCGSSNLSTLFPPSCSFGALPLPSCTRCAHTHTYPPIQPTFNFSFTCCHLPSALALFPTGSVYYRKYFIPLSSLCSPFLSCSLSLSLSLSLFLFLFASKLFCVWFYTSFSFVRYFYTHTVLLLCFFLLFFFFASHLINLSYEENDKTITRKKNLPDRISFIQEKYEKPINCIKQLIQNEGECIKRSKIFHNSIISCFNTTIVITIQMCSIYKHYKSLYKINKSALQTV